MSNNDSGNIFDSRLITLEDIESEILKEERYEDRVEIGRGGQTTVYRIYDKKLKVYRAMKVLDPELSKNPTLVEKFINEIRLTAELKSPNIVKVYDGGLLDDELFLVMDYIEGGRTVDQLGKLPKSMAAIIAYKAALALEYAHNREINVNGRQQVGIMHRDVKPGNLMIAKDGEVMVIDFGLSQVMSQDTRNEHIMGSLPYMAPEQFEKKVTKQSDIYQLGVSLYQMLSGQTGYEDLTAREIMGKKLSTPFMNLTDKSYLDSGLENIIKKATETNERHRYFDFSEMIADLKLYIYNNYNVDLDLTRVLGAYVNFKILPPEIEQKKPKKMLKTLSWIIGGVFFLFAAAFGVWKLLPTPEKAEPPGREIVSEVDEQDDAQKRQDEEEVKVVKPVAGESQKKKTTPSTKYTLTVRNPEGKDGKITIGGKVYKISRKQKSLPIDLGSAGTYTLKIVSDDCDPFLQDIAIQDHQTYIDYLPPEYSIDFDFPSEAKNFTLTINDKSLGTLKSLPDKRFTTSKSGSYMVSIVDKKKEYMDIETGIKLERGNQRYKFEVKPIPRQKYVVTISNPDNVAGMMTINGNQTIPFSGVYQQSFKEPDKVVFEIQSEGYEPGKFVADFSENASCEFIYSPTPLKMSLVITNSPANGEITLNSEYLGMTSTGETVLADVPVRLKSNNTLTIKAPGYRDWTTKFSMSSVRTTIDYSGVTMQGSLTITPQLSDILAGKTKLFLNGNQIDAFTQELENLPMQSHLVSLVFQIGDYNEVMRKNFTLSQSNPSARWDLDIDQVTIVSNAEKTKLEIDGLSVGYAPVTIPFINKNVVRIVADPENLDRKEASISPKDYSGKKYAFRFPVNPKAELLYSEAKAIIDSFNTGDNVNILTGAEIKLQEALSLNKMYPEALLLSFKIYSERVRDANNSDNTANISRYCEKANNLYKDNNSSLEDDRNHALILGYLTYNNYFLAIRQNDPSAKASLLGKCLSEYGEKYILLRNKISVKTKWEQREKDRLDFHYGLLCQELWKIDPTKQNKKRAKKAWSMNPFNPYHDDRDPSKTEQNPYRNDKNQYYNDLDSQKGGGE